MWGAWTGSSWLRIGTVSGTCEYGNEPSGSIKYGKFFDYYYYYYYYYYCYCYCYYYYYCYYYCCYCCYCYY